MTGTFDPKLNTMYWGIGNPGPDLYGDVRKGDNLFTITSYEGLDPSLPAANVFGAAGDVRDQYRGVDRGSYPSNRIFSVGIVTSF